MATAEDLSALEYVVAARGVELLAAERDFLEAVQAARAGGLSIRRTARLLGMSSATMHRWYAQDWGGQRWFCKIDGSNLLRVLGLLD